MTNEVDVPDVAGDEEVVVISDKRRDLSYNTQVAGRAHIVTLGNDLTRIVFGKLLLRECIVVSHVCAYWRWLAVNDPLLWTLLSGSPARIPVLYARAGPTIAIDLGLDFRWESLHDIVSCISRNFKRIKGLRLIAHDDDCVPAAVWSTVLNTLCRPGQCLRRLHLEDGDVEPSIFALDPRGLTGRLRELALLGILVSDFSLLPVTLVSFAYWNRTSDKVAPLTFRDLQAILRTCPALKDLRLCVALQASLAEIEDAAKPPIQLHRLRLRFLGDENVTQDVLDFMTCQNMHHVDVCHWKEDPVYNLLTNFEGHSISILPSTIGQKKYCCDIAVTDCSDRSRRIRGADFDHIRTCPLLWSSLVSLTICGKRLERPPPHAPCLQYLRLLYYPRQDIHRTINPIEPWKLADRDGEWQCPNLHTIEFALVVSRYSYGQREEIGRPLLLPSSAVLKFVTGELSHSRVTRVIVKGDNIHIQSEPDEELPFTLSCDTSDSRIETVERDFVFRGFDSEY